MKVLLATLNSKYSHINIALYYLKNCIKDICDVVIKNYTINDNLDNVLEDIMKVNADLICFGCYIWNIEQTIKLAKNIYTLNSNIKIAFGGPEVSYNPDEILKMYPFISSVMCGEGEISIQNLVNDLKTNSIKQIYNNPVNIEFIPKIADDIITNYDNRVTYFETSRGCPYRCSYCLSCIDKNIKYFDLDSSINELKKLLDKNVKQIRFIDRTFNSDRKRALKIWKFLINNRKDTTFHFEICVNLIDDETLEFLKSVPKDIFQFEIGVQSTNKDTLLAINRGYKWEHEKKMLYELRKFNNIKLHTDLIIGLPYETLDIFKNSFNELYSIHPHEIQVGFLKLLKGTDIYDKKDEFEYKFTDEPPYEVLENKFISYKQIRFLKKFEDVFETLCNSGYFKTTLSFLENKYNNYYELFEDITNYFIKNNYFLRKFSIEETFTILDKMYKQDKDYIVINQALTLDYFLKFNGHRNWHYNNYEGKTKDILNEFIEKNRNTLFNTKRNSDIYKEYKFLILDYNFENNKIEKKLIYYVNKN